MVTYYRRYYRRDDWKFKGAVLVSFLVDTVGTIAIFCFVYNVSRIVTSGFLLILDFSVALQIGVRRTSSRRPSSNHDDRKSNCLSKVQLGNSTFYHRDFQLFILKWYVIQAFPVMMLSQQTPGLIMQIFLTHRYYNLRVICF
jgi:hypothetical protein